MREKREPIDEFYQVLYESAYTVWLEKALSVDKSSRLEHTCMLVYIWHTLIETFNKSGLNEQCP